VHVHAYKAPTRNQIWWVAVPHAVTNSEVARVAVIQWARVGVVLPQPKICGDADDRPAACGTATSMRSKGWGTHSICTIRHF
jgi:hypothetical protein